jgi:hypothetical protein
MKFKMLVAILMIVIGTTKNFAQDEGDKYVPGRGFNVIKQDWGEVNFRLYTYIRYLNQLALEDSFTNSFVKTSFINKRQDIQINKVVAYFFGWLLDKKFRYMGYVWSANTSQGLGAQVVVAGFLNYNLNQHFKFGLGINSLPSTRSTIGNFPFWLGVDNRLIADEFFRGSFTTGIWADGEITPELDYKIMLGNNLSQLGVDAGQLDNILDTWCFTLAWMPTTGEFGFNNEFGDYDNHQTAATRFAAHFTTSTEDRQSQPGTQDPDNVQVRLSDGSIIFTPGLFGDGILVNDVNYNMFAFDAGVKYKGYALEGEYFLRTLNNIHGTGVDNLSFSELTDYGFQLQASSMVIDKTLQLYLSGSKIFGDYGNPWDGRFGANWYLFDNQAVRLNGEVIYLNNSPVGALSLPYTVGGKGPVFHLNLELRM